HCMKPTAPPSLYCRLNYSHPQPPAPSLPLGQASDITAHRGRVNVYTEVNHHVCKPLTATTTTAAVAATHTHTHTHSNTHTHTHTPPTTRAGDATPTTHPPHTHTPTHTHTHTRTHAHTQRRVRQSWRRGEL